MPSFANNSEQLLSEILTTLGKIHESIKRQEDSSRKNNNTSTSNRNNNTGSSKKEFSFWSFFGLGFPRLKDLSTTFSKENLKTSAEVILALANGLYRISRLDEKRIVSVLTPVTDFIRTISKLEFDDGLENHLFSLQKLIEALVSISSKVKIRNFIGLFYLNLLLNEGFINKIKLFFESMSNIAATMKDEDIKKVTGMLNALSGLAKGVAILALTFVGIALIGGLGLLATAIVSTAAVIGLSMFVLTALSKVNNGTLQIAKETGKELFFIMAGMALIAATIVLVGYIATPSSIAAGGAIALASLGISMLALYLINLINFKDEADAKFAMGKLKMMAGVIAGIAAISLMIVIIGQFDSNTLLNGGLVMISEVLVLMGVMKILSSMTKTAERGARALLLITSAISLLSVISVIIMPLFAKRFGEITVGLLAMTATMIGLSFALRIASKTGEYVQKTGMAFLAIVAAVGILSVISLLIIPQFANKMGTIALGMLILVGAMIGLSFALKIAKDTGQNVSENGLAFLALTAGVLVMSFAILTISFAIERIGKMGFKDAIQGMIAAGIIMAGLYALIRIIVDSDIKDDKIKNAAILTGLLTVVSLTFIGTIMSFASFLDRISIYTPDQIWHAFGVASAIIGGLSGIVVITITLEKFAKGRLGGAAIILGMMAGFGVALMMVVNMFASFIERFAKLSSESVWSGTGAILGILGGIALMVAAVGSLVTSPVAIVIVAGIATIAGLGVAFMVLGSSIDKYITIIEKLADISTDRLNLGISNMKSLMDGMVGLIDSSLLLKSAAMLIPGLSVGMMLFIGMVSTIQNMINKYIDLMIKYVDATNRYGDMSNASLKIATGFKNFVANIFSGITLGPALKIMFFSHFVNLKDIIEAVSDYVDIVMKVASLRIIVGYDSNGKPRFKKISEEEFGNAGTKVAESFSTFLTKLLEGIESLDYFKIDLIDSLGGSLGGIMKGVSSYVDAIMKMATGTYLVGYDENGKAIFNHVSQLDLTNAANLITTQFIEFLNNLMKGISGINKGSTEVIESLGKGIGPLMEGISSFVDSMIKLATAQLITGYDGNGKPIFGKISINETVSYIDENGSQKTISLSGSGPNAIIAAGSLLSLVVIGFFSEIYSKLSSKEGFFERLGRKMTGDPKIESIPSLMDGMSKFVESLLKIATLQVIDHYDDNGKPVFRELEFNEYDEDGNFKGTKKGLAAIIAAGSTLASSFISFFKTLYEKINEKGSVLTESNAEKVKTIMEPMKPVLEMIETFADVLKAFQDPKIMYKMKGMKNGKPEFDFSQPISISDIATNIADGFGIFMSTFITQYKIVEEDYKTRLNGIKSFGESLDAVINLLEPFVKFGVQLKDVNTGDMKAKTPDLISLLLYIAGFSGINDKPKVEYGENIGARILPAVRFYNNMIGVSKNAVEIAKNLLIINNQDIDKKRVESFVDSIAMLSTVTTKADRVKGLFDTIKSIFGGTTDFNNRVSEFYAKAVYWSADIKNIAANFFELNNDLKDFKNPSDIIGQYINALTSISSFMDGNEDGLKLSEYSWNIAESIYRIEEALFKNREKRKEALDELSLSINTIANDLNSLTYELQNLSDLKQLNLATQISLQSQQGGLNEVRISNPQDLHPSISYYPSSTQQQSSAPYYLADPKQSSQPNPNQDNQRPLVAMSLPEDEEKTIIVEFANTRLEGKLTLL